MEFEKRKECDKMRTFILSRNEEMFNKLERFLKELNTKK